MASVEVMTACENVCRDFGWLVPSDPRTIQGLLTVFAALIASGTAIYIAKFLYPVQKKYDRRLQINLEQRNAYGEVVSSLFEARTALEKVKAEKPDQLSQSLDEVRDAIRSFEIEAQKSSILMEAETVNHAQACIEALRAGLKSFGEELGQVEVGEAGVGARVVEELLDKERKRALERFNEEASSFVNEVRKSAFGFDDQVKFSLRSGSKKKR